MVPLICLSSTLRSVTTTTESKRALPSRSSPMSWWASQAMELDLPLPAELLDQILGADSPTGHVRQQLAHHVELVVAGP